jgi:hypothetical protein
VAFGAPILAFIMAAVYIPPSVKAAREAVRRSASDWPMMGNFSANWRNPDARDLHRWIGERTAPGAVLASTQPWALSYHTGRPAVLLPFDMDEATLRRFLDDFHVDFLILNPDYPQPVFRREADYGATLERLGFAPPRRVGSYRIHDLAGAGPGI